MKGNRISHPATDIDPSQIDAIIKDYQTQIKTAVQSAAAAQYGLAGIKPQTGIIFNIES
jgi:acyl-CoA hydrolase